MQNIKIVPDAFGWLLIRSKGVTLQAFRTETECRQWIADAWPILRIYGHVPW